MESIIPANSGFSIIEGVRQGPKIVDFIRTPVVAWGVVVEADMFHVYPICSDFESQPANGEDIPDIENPDGTILTGTGEYFDSLEEYRKSIIAE